jgi:catechol 2,3-dioxygenase-like lactoylglutathione lyase family enzyme
MIKFDHVAIVVRDIEKATRFYKELFGWEQPKSGPKGKIQEVNMPGVRLRFTPLVLNDLSIELMEPKEGPWFKRLKEKGEGICKICVAVDDIDEFANKVEKMGLKPLDRLMQPLVKEKYVVGTLGGRFFYLPVDKTFGTYIEVLEER